MFFFFCFFFKKQPPLHCGCSATTTRTWNGVAGLKRKEAACLYLAAVPVIVAAPWTLPCSSAPSSSERRPVLIKDQRRSPRSSPCCRGKGKLLFWGSRLQTSSVQMRGGDSVAAVGRKTLYVEKCKQTGGRRKPACKKMITKARICLRYCRIWVSLIYFQTLILMNRVVWQA